jgi:hypothetical protein
MYATANGFLRVNSGGDNGPSYPLHVSGTGYASDDFRAPIFYDANDTGYYLDPNGTNRLNLINAGNNGSDTGLGIFYGAGAGDYGRIRFYQAGTNGSTIHIFSTAWQGGSLQSTAAGSINIQGTNGVTFGSWDNVTTWMDNSGNVQSRGSMRSPIFYDSDDTGYYVNPNSETRLTYVSVNAGNEGIGGANSSNLGLILRVSNYNSNTWAHKFHKHDPGGGVPLVLSWAYGGAAWSALQSWGSASGYSYTSQVYGTFRANETYGTIFYDANDTSRYLDPNGSSVFGGNVRITPTSEGWAEGLSFVMPNTSTWGGLRWRRERGNYDGNWYVGYTALDGTDDLVFGANNGGSQIDNILRLTKAGIAINNYSVRSPIFYDSENTAYYCDPTSTSRVNRLRVGNGSDAWIDMTDDESPNGIKYIHANSNLIGFVNGSGSWIFNVDNSGNSSNPGSAKSTIYYDYNDTAYYIDPAGYSQHNGNGSVNGSAGVGFSVWSQGGNGAIMSYHRGGAYAINLGLDSDNVIRWGGWSASANRLQMDMSGNLTMAGNVTAYSDERLKKDWASLPTDFIEQLAKVKSGTYTRIDSEERQVGVSAQGLQEFLAEAVQTDAAGMLSVNYGGAALASAVELAKEVVELKTRVAELEALVNKLIGDKS